MVFISPDHKALSLLGVAWAPPWHHSGDIPCKPALTWRSCTSRHDRTWSPPPATDKTSKLLAVWMEYPKTWPDSSSQHHELGRSFNAGPPAVSWAGVAFYIFVAQTNPSSESRETGKPRRWTQHLRSVRGVDICNSSPWGTTRASITAADGEI